MKRESIKKDKWNVVWDKDVVDSRKTTALPVLHRPDRIAPVFAFDAPWESKASSYHHIVKCHDGIYRLYYISYPLQNPQTYYTHVCCLESTDCVNWTRPEYGLYEFEGSKRNNIVFQDLREGAMGTDNFMVFLDPNPKCKPEERYKAVGLAACINNDWSVCDLWCYVSPDGIHWKYSHTMFSKLEGMSWCFDSDNHIIWDGKRYVLYFRGRHRSRDYVQKAENVKNESLRNIEQDIYNYRDIRVAYSDDFRKWEIYGELDYEDGEDYQVYANHIMKYPRNEDVLIGFPVRNVERRSLEGTFSRLGGAVNVCKRNRSFAEAIRSAVVTTDAVFMVSKDGKRWRRSSDAFYTAGPESPYNWAYGDGYIVPYFFETKGRFNGIDNEYSSYFVENSRSVKAKELTMYKIRLDGFYSYHADYYGAKLVTKKMTFKGEKMLLNFSTSALGHIFVTISDGEKTVKSLEVFGNSASREVDFEEDIKVFNGKKVTVTFEMKEADVYSFIFK